MGKRKKGIDLALKKKWGDKKHGLDEPKVKATNEEVKQLDEISKGKLAAYIKAASHDVATKSAATGRYADRANRVSDEMKKGDYSNYTQGKKDNETANKMFDKSWKRRKGIAKAADKMVKEEQLDEKAVSKAQQRLFGIALATRRGETDRGSEAATKLAADLPEKELKKFAKTKLKGLPKKLHPEKKVKMEEEITLESVLAEIQTNLGEQTYGTLRQQPDKQQPAKQPTIQRMGGRVANPPSSMGGPSDTDKMRQITQQMAKEPQPDLRVPGVDQGPVDKNAAASQLPRLSTTPPAAQPDKPARRPNPMMAAARASRDQFNANPQNRDALDDRDAADIAASSASNPRSGNAPAPAKPAAQPAKPAAQPNINVPLPPEVKPPTSQDIARQALRAPVQAAKGEGATGKELASSGVSREDRRSQSFVDKTLGAGKYTAGSAESNIALKKHFSGLKTAAAGESPAKTEPASVPTPPPKPTSGSTASTPAPSSVPTPPVRPAPAASGGSTGPASGGSTGPASGGSTTTPAPTPAPEPAPAPAAPKPEPEEKKKPNSIGDMGPMAESFEQFAKRFINEKR